MREALAEAAAAAEHSDVPVGAVVVRDGVIIARGHNRRELDGDATAHAETVAIRAACAAVGGRRLDDCALYVTLEPCPMCAGAIYNAGISRVVYGCYDDRAGALGGAFDLFDMLPDKRPQIKGGVLGTECAALLSSFFEGRRP